MNTLEKYRYASEEELAANSVNVEITDNDTLIFDPSDYPDEDGIRYFEKPLKVPAYIWPFAIPGLLSLVYLTNNTKTMYVFAVTATENDNIKLADIQRNEEHNSIYRLMPGYSKEEVMSID